MEPITAAIIAALTAGAARGVMTDLTSSESVPPWYKDFMDVFRYGFPIHAKGHTVTPPPLSGRARRRPSRVRPLNVRGIMPEPLAYVLEQILR